jgi:hypothetical protein
MGMDVGSCMEVSRADRESRIVASYRNTKLAAAMTVATIFRPSERAIKGNLVVLEVLESLWNRSIAGRVSQHKRGFLRDDTDSRERKTTNRPADAPEPPTLRRPDREQQFVIIAASEGARNSVDASLFVPSAHLIVDRKRVGIDDHADARCRCDLTSCVAETIA